MALVRVKPTQADVAIADDIAARASRRSARVTVVGQRPFLGELQGVALAAGRYRILVDLVAHSITATNRVLAADKPRKKTGFPQRSDQTFA